MEASTFLPFVFAEETKAQISQRRIPTGLSITKQIVALHGGTVSVRNMNDGVQFGMTLPV